jgi:hypothetical protein
MRNTLSAVLGWASRAVSTELSEPPGMAYQVPHCAAAAARTGIQSWVPTKTGHMGPSGRF